jgi:hypothetical protein
MSSGHCRCVIAHLQCRLRYWVFFLRCYCCLVATSYFPPYVSSPFYSFIGFIRLASPYVSVLECSTGATHRFLQATYRSCWSTASLFAFDLSIFSSSIDAPPRQVDSHFPLFSLIMIIYSSLPFYLLFNIHT